MKCCTVLEAMIHQLKMATDDIEYSIAYKKSFERAFFVES